MAEIVGMDEVVPEDIDFQYKGKSYVFPGDVSVADTFRIRRYLRQLAEAELAVAKTDAQGAKRRSVAEARQEKLTLEVESFLLEQFQKRQPDLEALPWGVVGFQIVLAHLLTKLGFGVGEPENTEEPPDPPKRKPKKT